MKQPVVVTRSRLAALAAALGILVLLESAAALFALSYSNQCSLGAIEDIHQIEEAQNRAWDAQLNFHVQVQEWKNILLRGHDSADYKEFFDRFKAREADVTQALVDLKKTVAKSDADTAAVSKIAREHEELGAAYRLALDKFKPNDPATVFAVDQAVRGKDRQITIDIDAIADRFNAQAGVLIQSTEQAAARHYSKLHTVLLVLGAITVLVTIWFIVESLKLTHRVSHH